MSRRLRIILVGILLLLLVASLVMDRMAEEDKASSGSKTRGSHATKRIEPPEGDGVIPPPHHRRSSKREEQPAEVGEPPVPRTERRSETSSPTNSATATADKLRIPNVTVHDLDGRVAWQGTVDLAPTLERIERGERLEYHDDGSVFQNRESHLPHKPSGYYHEWVVRTPGLGGPGPQRVVTGREGELWYSSDHYHHFTRVK